VGGDGCNKFAEAALDRLQLRSKCDQLGVDRFGTRDQRFSPRIHVVRRRLTDAKER
jgi:hypothetical protein